MDLLQFIVGAVKVGKYIYDEHQAHKIEDTEEFKKELKEIEAGFCEKNDYELALKFKQEYGDYNGEGLILPATYNGDVQFRAYMNVLKSRGFEKIYARCTCEMQVGFLMLPPTDSPCYKKIEESSFLNNGLCDCNRCGRKKFKVMGQFIIVEDL